MIATDAGLDILFQLIQGHIDALAMCRSDALITSDQGREGYTLGCAESCVPCCAMRHRPNGFFLAIGILVAGSVLDKLLFGDRVLTIGKAGEVLFVHFASETPARR